MPLFQSGYSFPGTQNSNPAEKLSCITFPTSKTPIRESQLFLKSSEHFKYNVTQWWRAFLGTGTRLVVENTEAYQWRILSSGIWQGQGDAHENNPRQVWEMAPHKLTGKESEKFLPQSLRHRLMSCPFQDWEDCLSYLILQHLSYFEIRSLFGNSNWKGHYGAIPFVGMHFYQVSGCLSLRLPLDPSGCQHGLWRRALTERQRDGSDEALGLC